jgi:dihydrodipicolinate synthase/N-acetylneuraminate lyase
LDNSSSEVSGLIVPIVTPMNEDFSIDKIGLKIHLSKLMNLGVKNFLLFGQVGEFEFLNLEQEVEVIRGAINTVDGRGKVFVGCFDKTSDLIIEKVNLADRLGASACFVNIPLNALTNEVFFMDYFEEVFNQTKSNLFIYNNPRLFKRNIPIRGIEKIANWEKLIGINDSSGNYEYFREIANFKQTMKIFQEYEQFAFDSLRLNCAGLVSSTANINSTIFLELIKQFKLLNFNGMLFQQKKINQSLSDFIVAGKEIQCYKYILTLKGIMQHYHSKQLDPLTEKEKYKLEKFVKLVI